MFKILGIDDSVNACECCGKQNLKSTVIVEVDGEILHYGSVCATRHTKLSSREITAAVRAADDGRKLAARKEYEASIEHVRLQVKQSEAHRAGLVGKPFAEYCASERSADRVTWREISAKFGGIQF